MTAIEKTIFFPEFPSSIKKLFQILLLSSLLFSIIVFSIVLYLTQTVHMSPANASDIETTFVATNFCLHFLGGIIGSKYIENRNICGLSLIAQASGAALMAYSQQTMLWGLSIILLGTGLTFISINCILTNHLRKYSEQRDTVFLWAYGIMNLGFLIGLTLTGISTIYHQHQHLLFLCSFANFTALYILIKNWHLFKEDTQIKMLPQIKQTLALGALAIICIPLLHFALEEAAITNIVTLLLGSLAFTVLGILTFPKATYSEKQKLKLFFLLVAGAIIFWTLYQLTPNLMMLFIKHHVDRSFFDIQLPPQWFANINPIIILFGAPVLAKLLQKSKQYMLEPSLPTKFASGLLFMSCGAVIFIVGILSMNGPGLLAPYWILLKITFESIAELLISPIGLAMIGILIPVRWQNMFMGSWMLINGIASSIAGFIAHETLTPAINSATFTSPENYVHSYFLLASVGLICSFLLFSIATTIKSDSF